MSTTNVVTKTKTKPRYHFTRPIRKNGSKANYFTLLEVIRDGKKYSYKDAMNEGVYRTLQSLKDIGYLGYDKGESAFFITDLGKVYIEEMYKKAGLK